MTAARSLRWITACAALFILAALLLVPMVAFFGEGLPGVLEPGQQRIAEMSPGAISSKYVRYIDYPALA